MRWITGWVLVCLCAGDVSAEEYKPGDKVVVVVEGNLTVSGSKVVDSVWPGLVLTVGDVNGEWLWLSNGKPGYLSRDKVIPLNRAAIDRLTELLKANPSSANLYSGRADVWQKLGELDIALGDYSEVIRITQSASSYHNRGQIWQAKQEYGKALADYNESLRLDPKGAYVYNSRGNVWQDKQEYDKALADYNESLRLDPKYTTAYNNRGNVWKAKQEYNKALVDYNEALRLDPKFALAYNSRGNVWQDKQEYDKALADFGEALRLDPKNAGAYHNRGNAWYYKQEYDKALADYNEALRLDPKDSTVNRNRSYTWLAKQEYDKAIADCSNALSFDSKDAEAYNNRGNAWYAKQDYDKALADYDESLRLDPKDARAALSCGVTRLALRKKRAYIDFSDVLDIEKGKGVYSPYAVILGHLTARLLGDEPVAKQFLDDKASQLPPAWPTPTVTFLRGQIDEPAYLALADTNDKQTDAHCFLGLKALADQQTAPARTHFEWVRDQGNKTFIEYGIAIAELKRLDQKTP